MTVINWPAVQRRLSVDPDGIAGKITYTALASLVGAECPSVGLSLAKYAAGYGFTTPARLAELLAQCANETGGWRVWIENLNYSISAMRNAWPSRFPSDGAASPYARNPEDLANKVYGGRMGNDQPDDGWRYRGRGALQLTGKANYANFGKLLGLDLVGNPDLAADPYNSMQIAMEFFREGNVNAAVDAGDFVKARRITNGGTIGLENVARLRNRLIAVLA